jgi:FAD/FMN-containing dehydrogenase
LNEQVGGNLLKVESLFAHGPIATQDLRNPFFLGDQPGGTQISGWVDAWTPAASAFAVKAKRTEDVVAAVNFARERRLRLVVKGAGHSYLGTSNAPDSLLLWTRAMNAVTVHDAFVPKGSGAAPVPAVTAEAGAVWIDLYHEVTTLRGRYVQGGGCADVGVAGLVQSGGFGSFSKNFGTASAHLLEAEIVTADGVARVVNENNDPELFWALKGGGGGSWGVVTRVTLRTHELPKNFGVAWGKIEASSDGAFRRLLAHFFDFYHDRLFNPHWGEHVVISPMNMLELSLVAQGLDNNEIKRLWQPFWDWLADHPSDYTLKDKPGAAAFPARNWWNPDSHEWMNVDPRPDAPKYHAWWKGDQGEVGAFLYGYDSTWLPAALLETAQRPSLVDALFAASRHQEVQLQFNKGLAAAPLSAVLATQNTAMNPAVLNAFAFAIIAAGEGPAYPGQPRPPLDLKHAREGAKAVADAAALLRRVAPGAGSYVSESNFFNRTWQRAYWGNNYERLRAVKAAYDPDGLFFVRHGVGSETWTDDGFARLP